MHDIRSNQSASTSLGMADRGSETVVATLGLDIAVVVVTAIAGKVDKGSEMAR